MQAPLFSIIIPTYNRAHLIPETLKSVLAQTYQKWECIVVDDGSTDNTRDIVAAMGDPRIRYFWKKNAERSAARNYGVNKAGGSYICFLDSDDLYYPNHLTSLYSKINKENFPKAVFNTGMWEQSDRGRVARAVYSPNEYSHPVHFVWEKFMLPTSVCVHRELLKVHKFPEKFNVWEDTHLWLRLLSQNKFFQIEEISAQWNIHPEGSVSRAFNKIDSKHVENYLKCISDLFKNHGDLLQPYLYKQDMRVYQFKKLKMFLELSFKKGDYKTFIKLYFIGLKFVGKKKLSLFVSRKLFRKIKSRIK
ncbi:MAG: glycosyltransferase [Salegentibacter mishustinae]|nr:glycosyltransferase [Salegentibacter mishustinae]